MILRFVLIIFLLAIPCFGQTPPVEAGVSQQLAKWRAAHYSDVRYKLNLTLEKMSPVLKGTMEIRVNVSALPRGTHFNGGLVPDRQAASASPVQTGAPVPPAPADRDLPPIILDWRKIRGHEGKSTISNVSINGRSLNGYTKEEYVDSAPGEKIYIEQAEHLIFQDRVVEGENVIKLDFTSPILTSGSAITRYVDKEDGAEYIYSLFVPSDASTAFPVFDQPDLKARFTLEMEGPPEWKTIANEYAKCENYQDGRAVPLKSEQKPTRPDLPPEIIPEFVAAVKECAMNTADLTHSFAAFSETKPISTYVFAFAAGPWEKVGGNLSGSEGAQGGVSTTSRTLPTGRVSAFGSVPSGRDMPLSDTSVSASGDVQPPATAGGTDPTAVSDARQRPPATVGGTDLRGGPDARRDPAAAAPGTDVRDQPSTFIYVRKSQAAKFKPHAAEVFRLNREAVRYFEQYFDYKFPFPKYDLVLIPEFPFGGMEHAGATFLREASVIFPQEPTKNDHISRATLIFHETAHQWFGDTVTMRWFDDLWLKEGFATFTAYKAMEKIMPEMNAWKVFYERIKQGAYQTDSTRGTTAIYQPIANLSAAKSAYGNIVYNKAPAFLRQAEFYLGEDKFQTAVRAFLKKHEFGNAGWEDLVTEFEAASGRDLKDYASKWVTRRGLPMIKGNRHIITRDEANLMYMSQDGLIDDVLRPQSINVLVLLKDGQRAVKTSAFAGVKTAGVSRNVELSPQIKFDGSPVFFRHVSALIPNYGDYGYGIFLLDEKSRDYVLKNIQNEKDPFLRTMMWGALWDSVREGDLDPRVFVELVVKVLVQEPAQSKGDMGPSGENDESTIATLLGRTGTALNYYMSEPPAVAGGAFPAGAKAPPATAGGTDKTAYLRARVEDLLIERMQNAPTLGQRITYYRAFLNIAASERARGVLKTLLRSVPPAVAGGSTPPGASGGSSAQRQPPATAGGTDLPLKAKDRFDIVTRLLVLGDPEAMKLLAELEKTERGDDAKRYAYAARAGIGTAENKAKYWNDFVNNKEISESWIEAAFGPWNSIRHSDLTLPYLERALKELPNHKRNRKIFFVNGWLGAFIGGQRSSEALAIVNKFLAENPALDNDLRLKILENVDLIERAVKIRSRFAN